MSIQAKLQALRASSSATMTEEVFIISLLYTGKACIVTLADKECNLIENDGEAERFLLNYNKANLETIRTAYEKGTAIEASIKDAEPNEDDPERNSLRVVRLAQSIDQAFSAMADESARREQNYATADAVRETKRAELLAMAGLPQAGVEQ